MTGSGLVSAAVSYEYTSDLRVRKIRLDGRAASDYVYDADGLVVKGGQLIVTRDAATGAIVGDSVGVLASTKQYDAHGDLRRLDLRLGGTTILSRLFARDSIGRIVTAADSGANGTLETSYRYDELDRLNQVSVDGTVALALTYDLAGNRLTRTTNAGISSATYASDDRLLSMDGHAITHDSAGARTTELTATDSLTFGYDDLGRLTRIASRTLGTLTFRLDGLGRRAQELRDGIVARQFVYGATEQPIAELTGSGNVRSEFVYVSGDVAPDYLLQGGKTIYLVHDQLGSVRKAIDAATGSVLQEIDYDATGVIVRNTNPGLQPFGYAGGLMDLDGRFVHFQARDYDARTGRWLVADPLGAAAGRNRYEYAASDPIRYTDPTGLDCRKVRCPSPRDIIENENVKKAACELYKRSEKDGNEYGAFLFNGPNGTIRIGPYIKGTPTEVPQMGSAPADAIGSIHTHSDGTGPSGRDVTHAQVHHINVEVVTRGSLYILDQFGKAKYETRRSR